MQSLEREHVSGKSCRHKGQEVGMEGTRLRKEVTVARAQGMSGQCREMGVRGQSMVRPYRPWQGIYILS